MQFAFFSSGLLLFLQPISVIGTTSITAVNETDCKISSNTNTYFDTERVACRPCPTGATPSADALNCICKPGYIFTRNFGGEQVRCQQCSANEIPSEDGWQCVSCGSLLVDQNNPNKCNCRQNTGSISYHRSLTGNRNLNGTTWVDTCSTCASQTLPNTLNTRCTRCTDLLKMINSSSCQCGPSGGNSEGGVCFQTGDLPTNIANADLSMQYLNRLEVDPTKFLQSNLKAAYGMCTPKYLNMTACQSLSNMCTMRLYKDVLKSCGIQNACCMYKTLLGDTSRSTTVNSINSWKANLPWLVYEEQTTQVADDPEITAEYSFRTEDPNHRLNIKAMKFTPEGDFVGQFDVAGGFLQLCNDSYQRQEAAFRFGVNYEAKCPIPVRFLFDNPTYETAFYDLYLSYMDGANEKLYPIPVLFLQYQDDNEIMINKDQDRRNDWVFFRRFFIVDRISGVPGTGNQVTSAKPRVLRVASEMTLTVKLQKEASSIAGRIYPPILTLNYTEVTSEDYDSNHEIMVTFKVVYEMDNADRYNDFSIAVGVLAALAIIYAVFQAWSWSRRSGRIGCDFIAVLVALSLIVQYLASVFMACLVGNAVYQFCFYKLQGTVNMLVDTRDQETYFTVFLAISGFLFFLAVVFRIVKQVSIDIFFIDWERPHSSVKLEDRAVSSWRTIMATNEWNEVQTIRKTNFFFQIVVTVFFLAFFPAAFENWAHSDPYGGLGAGHTAAQYRAPFSRVMRFAVGFIVYIVIYACQFVFFMFFYERCVEHKLRQYVDMLSMSNISVFILENDQFGYYIHGRSPHGTSDVSMKEMAEQLKREELNLVGTRGLLPNTEQQTFMVSVPKKFRTAYDKILRPLYMSQAQGRSRQQQQQQNQTPNLDEQKNLSMRAYDILNSFLSRFIEHALHDIDYMVLDKPLIETIFSCETREALDCAYFYNDGGHAFDSVLFYGHELLLFSWDITCFLLFDWIATDFVLAGAVTFIFHLIFHAVRDGCGRRNLARKTLVDERFLI